jgi:ankyrin repeat protein
MEREFIDSYLSYEPGPYDFDLFEALMSGDEAGVRTAVTNGASIENIVYGGALNVLAWQGWSKDLCWYLVESGATLNAIDHRCGRTPLHGFAKQGWCDLIQKSIDEGCRVDQFDAKSGETALSLASRYGREDAVRLLMRCGAVA